jgi:hypothetical protein
VQADKRKIVSIAREKNTTHVKPKGSKPNGLSSRWLFVPIFGGLALILLMVFVLAAGAGIYFSGPRGAQTAILTDAAGVLEVSDSGVAGDWRLVSNGDKVRAGQRLRTGDESWVTLEFFDGTRTTLAPNTDLVLYEIDGNWGHELQVELIQNEGETNHQVVPLQGDQANYQVFTPSGEARVRGTSFKVMVEEGGVSLFTVETGEVLVSNNGNETYLAAGQGVVTELGKPLASPTYLFNLQGKLSDNSGKTWVVEGVDITVKGGTKIFGNPEKGDIVLVYGRITKKNEWIADRIEPPDPKRDAGGTFTGVVTSAGSDGLEINGSKFTIVDQQPVVEVGDLVRVTFNITDKGWEVVSLVLLDGDYESDDDPDAGPELSFKDDEIKITACEMSPELPSTTLNYKTDDEQALTLDVLLSADIIEGEEEGLVTGVLLYLDPNVDALDLNNPISIPRGTPVEIFIQVVLAEGVDILEFGDEIKVHVMAKGTLDSEDLTDDFKIKWECEEDDPESKLKFEPDEIEVPTCDVGSEFITNLVYDPIVEQAEALDVKLVASIVAGAEVNKVTFTLTPYGEESTTVEIMVFPGDFTSKVYPKGPIENNPTEISAVVELKSGLDKLEPGNELEIQLMVEGEVEGEILSDNFKIKWDCEDDDDDTDDDLGKEGHYCTTSDEHPHAATLANEYKDIPDVTYENIMIWFCVDNLGFGEIELGFKIYRQYKLILGDDLTIHIIFDKRVDEDLGWGQVKHYFANLAKEAQTDDEPEAKKETPGKKKSEDAKNKEKPNKKKKNDD